MKGVMAFGELHIKCEREVPLEHLSELIDELADEFVTIEITRRNYRGGVGGLSPEVAVVFGLAGAATVAASFLTELGKDFYKAARLAFYRLYDRTRIGVTASGRVWPMAFSLTFDQPKISILYVLEEDLSLPEFEAALSSVVESAQRLASDFAAESQEPDVPVAMYNRSQRRWELWK